MKDERGKCGWYREKNNSIFNHEIITWEDGG